MYDAFISYSQKRDKPIAQALRTVIQSIGKPWWRRRSLDIFLDATSLSAAPGLWPELERKLGSSRFLILLASREAAASPWVDKEVAVFLGAAGKGVDHILLAKTDGELAWDSSRGDFVWNEKTPLPPSLKGRFDAEPLWVDLRSYREAPQDANKKNADFLGRALDLAATIRGVAKEDLYSEELRRQRRNLAWAYGAAGALMLLAGVAGALGYFANEQRKIADSERQVAEQQRDSARRAQSSLLAESSVRARQDGNAERAVLLSLEALVGNDTASPPPYVPAAERSLREALFEHRLKAVLRPPDGGPPYRGAALNADGTLLATIEGAVNALPAGAKLWSVTADGIAPSDLLAGYGDKLKGIVLPRNGTLLAALVEDGTVQIWDARSRKLLLRLGPFAGGNVAAEFTTDARFIVVSADESAVLDTATGNRTQVIASPLHKLAFAGEGSRFATIVSGEGDTYHVEVREGSRADPIASWQVEGTQSLGMSRDGTTVATSTYGGASLWNADTGKLARAFKPHQNRSFAATLSHANVNPQGLGPEPGQMVPVGEFLATEGDDGVKVWGAFGDVPVTSILGSGAIWGAGDRLALMVSGEHEGTSAIEIWEFPFFVRLGYAPYRIARLEGHSRGVASLEFGNGGASFVTIDQDGVVRLWRVEPPLLVASRAGHESYADVVALSPDDARLATGNTDASISIYDARTLQPVGTIKRDEASDAVSLLAFSADARLLAVGVTPRAENGLAAEAGEAKATRLHIYDVADGKLRASTAALAEVPAVVRFSADGRLLIARLASGKALAFDAASGRAEASAPPPEADADQRAAMLEQATGRFMAALGITGDQLEQDYRGLDLLGDELVVARTEPSAYIWSPRLGRWMGELPVERFRTVEHVRGYADGERFLTVATERTIPRISLWRHFPTPRDAIEHAQSAVQSCLAPSEREALQLLPEPPRWCVEQGKWPYDTSDWKDWLARRDRGEAAIMPGVQAEARKD